MHTRMHIKKLCVMPCVFEYVYLVCVSPPQVDRLHANFSAKSTHLTDSGHRVQDASGSADLAVVDVLALMSKESAEERLKVVNGLLGAVFKEGKEGGVAGEATPPAGASALLHALAFLVGSCA